MTWLYQPLPLASTLTSGADADEALSGEASTSAAGTAGVDSFQALSGSASTGSSGSFNVELLVTNLITAEAGSTTNANNTVRLRSRKTGGASGTAERELSGTTFTASSQNISSTRVVSVLLGGQGIPVSIQSFPTRTTACLLNGQQRAMSTGMVIGTQNGTGFIPSWVQLPTQVDEENYYDTDFGIGSGKDEVWIWTAPDKATDFTVTPPVGVSTSNKDIHDDTEADDLWNHYNQYKRTGNQVNLDWAEAWRDYFVNVYPTDLGATGGEDASRNFDHLYGQGLVMWGMEQNDPAAKAAALTFAANAEANSLALVPGTTHMSEGESRRFARRLLFYNYICMMDPIPRWTAVRDHLINCWLQSPGWHDTTTSPATLIGGWHMAGEQQYTLNAAGNLGKVQYDAGFRYNSSFQNAILSEALWVSYKMTGNAEIRDMLIEMARFVLYYGWDPTHVNPMTGNRYGMRPDGSRWHSYQDEFTGWSSGPPSTGVGPPDVVQTDPTIPPADNYETASVNILVYGYKLTGETPFLKRAREHFRQATRYSAATNSPPVYATQLAENEVHFYVDTQKNSDQIYFNYNKGMLQYCSALFENGGDVSLEPSAGFQPPYPVPTAPGQVVAIGSDNSAATLAMGNGSGNTAWVTNVAADVRPFEVGSAAFGTQMTFNGDTRSKFIESYSQGGAIVIAGSGGHHGTINFGAILFDFEDGRWKRIWTTAGNPSVDNVAGLTGSGLNHDVRTGTRIHNCLNYEDDIIDGYARSSHNSGAVCWNSTDWPATAQSDQLSYVPFTADPRDQTWEVSIAEPYFWSATRVPPSGNPIISGPHGWQYPGEWNGLQANEHPGRFTVGGYITDSSVWGGRFDPTPAGTLEPTQSELPAPGHIWDMYYELKPTEGGGPRGSIILGRIQNQGAIGTTVSPRSHRFDLDTGIYHIYSTNNPVGVTSNPPGGGPWPMGSAIAGAEDPVMRRAFMIGKRISQSDVGTRVNYMNLSDGTWRNLSVGSGGVTPTDRTETMWVDPDRRLLMVMGNAGNYFWAFDLQTLGPEPIPTAGLGGWKAVPWDNVAGVQAHYGTTSNPWRYCPMNGKYYRIFTRFPAAETIGDAYAPPFPDITVLQRLTPPAIVTGTRANFYYTTEASSGRWTWDEMTLATPVPNADTQQSYAVCGHSWFHWVPAIDCFAYCPLDFGSGRPVVRRPVFLIKPF